ncbi:MAG: glycosyl hydrolase family 8 [Verrucomicrobiota bacterium]
MALWMWGGLASAEEKAAGAHATGRYRNLFAEAGHSAAEITAKVQAGFQQLFHGDPRTQAVFFAAGSNSNGPLAYLYDTGSGDVRSEGMSYGMMIAVQLDRKQEFDALWNWARTFMYHSATNHPAFGYFSWSMRTNGVANDEMPAPDGEEYFAMALHFAANRWGTNAGIYDYRSEANRLLSHLRHREVIRGKIRGGTKTAGPIFDDSHRMVRFTTDQANWGHTDPSYHLPAFYELWALWGPEEDRAFWKEAAAASREFFQKTTHPKTGLSPEYANFDGSPWAAPWNPNSANFASDACRTAMNWSVDWAWWAADPREQQLSDRLQAFFESRGLTNYGDRFTLDGARQLNTDHTTALVSMNAGAGLAATQARTRDFVEALWNTPVPNGRWRYYDGMLYLLGMLHCSGEFRIWSPR